MFPVLKHRAKSCSPCGAKAILISLIVNEGFPFQNFSIEDEDTLYWFVLRRGLELSPAF
jgi:hypothetical protein